MPNSVLENKVRKYLEQTAALNAFWKTAVTDQTLQRELERLAQGTRMPERLEELYAALGNDSFLIKECLARPTLVDRLTHNFYAFDATLHVKARAQADAIHRQLVAGELSPSADHPNRTVGQLVVSATDTGEATPGLPFQERVTQGELQKRRAELPARLGEVSEVKETREAFTFSVILTETATEVRVASYVVQKTPWDAWWVAVHREVESASVMAVASRAVELPVLLKGHPSSPSTTCADDGWDNGILTDPPESRALHTAVWTGNMMIVWGGMHGIGGYTNTGGRYDPATDSWTSMSTTGAPLGRIYHTAVWTGNLMVVWGGGQLASNDFNNGGRYDPTTDSWTPTSKVGAPSGRSSHTAVWTGNLMVVWGGNSGSVGGNQPLNTGGRYDPATDRWTPTATAFAPSARAGHTAIWTGSLMVVWGGYDGSGFPPGAGGRYDPAGDSWTPTTWIGAPTGRYYHTAIWTGSAMVIWGGYSLLPCDYPCNGGYYYDYVNTGARYDPATDTWTPTTTEGAPFPLSGHSAVWTGSLMLVWGGNAYSTPVGRYNPATDSWMPMSPTAAPSAREYQTAVWTGSLMIVWGGYTGGLSGFEDTGGRYDPETDSWTPTSTTSAPSERSGHTAVWTGTLMVIWGGYGGSAVGYFSSGGRYDPVLDNWTPTTTTAAPSGRAGHAAVWTGNLMLIWGAGNSGGRYDPATDSWTPTSEIGAPSGLGGYTAVWTGSLMVVWSGGSFPDYTVIGGRYDPGSDTWAPISTTGAPSGRSRSTSVWTGSLMVVWGGQTGGIPSLPNTGGRYDPATDSWTPTSTTGAPNGRRGHTAIWTENLMVVWGGDNSIVNGKFVSTGARYDPLTDSWTPVATTAAPSQRSEHAVVWTGTRMLIWGGGGANGHLVNNGGRYDPATDSWTRASKTGEPTNRVGPTAVWTGNAMIVWGGGGTTYFNDGGRYSPGTAAGDDCDADGFNETAGDCDDHDATTYPGAPQLCDGINNDCSDIAWPRVPTNESDRDSDGFGTCQGDCDDVQALVYPGAPQSCDGINNNCSDPTWPAMPANEADADGDHYRICDGDCNDANSRIGPDYAEFCDGLDNNCDGVIDNGGYADCDDQSPCTDDACAGVAGCIYTNNTSPCDDGYTCTADDICIDGSCVGTPLNGTACDDHDVCTTNDTCTSGYCFGGPQLDCDDGDFCNGLEFCYRFHGCVAGEPPYCDDGNPCTDDACDAVLGCVFTDNANPCNDGNVCTSADVCSGGSCRGTPLDGTACDDRNACTGDDACGAGSCHGGAAIDCSDGNACNGTETCYTGVGCSPGFPLNCNDSNPCTTDSCNSATGCVHANNTIPCSDGSVCTLFDTCGGGACVAGAPVDCDDQNPCTTDTCNPSTGCVHTNNVGPCSDGNACTVGDTCGGGSCYGTAIVCSDGNSCTDDHCEVTTGVCVYVSDDNNACSDGDACTIGDACRGGVCNGSTVVCNDNNVCTTDNCSPASGCNYTNNTNNCNDGSLCTLGDTCGGGSCQGTPIVCTDNNQCTDDSCDPATGVCGYSNDDTNTCDDGNRCTQTDICHSGACISSNPVQCSAGCAPGLTLVGALCQKTYNIGASLLDNQDGYCDDTGTNRFNDCNQQPYGFHWTDMGVSLAAVTRIDVEFESGLNCGGASSSATLNGVPVGSFDLVGSCDCATVHGTISFPNLNTGAYALAGFNALSIAPSGDCEGLSANENQGNSFARVTVTYSPYDECQVGACVPATGVCSFANRPDGTACTDDDACTSGDACGAGNCIAGAPTFCDDGNVCTDDSCGTSTGCAHTNNTNACDDGDACTTGDTCGGGTCHAGTVLVCDDNDRCTADSCNPAVGCVYTDTTSSCNDDNVCTTDTCDPAAGCVFTNNSNACNDGNACTQTDLCANGSCVGSNPIVCGPLDQCHTAGVCDPASGVCSNPMKPDGTVCNDNSWCTTGDVCQTGTCTPAFSGLNEPNPRTNGYYKRLCKGPHSGDLLTDADAVCVGQVATTFAGISTVAGICAVLLPSHPNDDPCVRTDADLMVLALNICHGRVCTAQSIDSQCGNNGNVGQSLAESDGILQGDSGDAATCAHAKCLDEEINTGRALEMNSLTLRREGSAVRLNWNPPYLDDGTGHPSKYHVWRRSIGSLAPFTKIGVTASATFLDAVSGSGAVEYEITAVMN